MINHLKLLCLLLITCCIPGLATAQSWKPDRLYVPLFSENWYAPVPAGVIQIESNENNIPGLLASYEDRFLGLTYSPGFYRSSNNTMAALVNIAKKFEINEDMFWAPTVSLITELEKPTGQFANAQLNPVLPSFQIVYKNFFANGLVIPENGQPVGRISFGITFDLN